MGSWIMQKYWDSDIFWLGDESVRGFRHFAFWRHATFLQINAFLRRIFSVNEKSGNFKSQKVTRLSWNPPFPLLNPNRFPTSWLSYQQV